MGDKQLLEINKKLLNFVDDEFKIKIRNIEFGLKYVSHFLFAKSTKTFRALNILCQNGYGEDAAILVRSILENVINLAYINKEDKQNRAELFIYYPYIDKKKKTEQLKSNKYYPNNIEEKFENKFREFHQKAIEIHTKELKRKKSENKYKAKKQSWSGLSLADMAKEINLKELYYDQIYWLISLFAHPSDSASINYIYDSKNGDILVSDMPSENWIKQALILGFDCYYKIIQLINDIFELKCEDKIKILEKEYLEITKK